MKKFISLSLLALSTVALNATVTEINADTNQAKGLFSQALKLSRESELVMVSGQLPLEAGTKELVKGDIQAQTNRIIDQIEALLKAGGSDLQHVLRVEIFLKDLSDFQAVNDVYAARFKSDVMPTRQTIQVAALPFGSPVEISCIGYAPAKKAEKQDRERAKDKKHAKSKADKKDKSSKKNKSEKKSKAQKQPKAAKVQKCVMPVKKKKDDVAPAKDTKVDAPAAE